MPIAVEVGAGQTILRNGFQPLTVFSTRTEYLLAIGSI